MGQWDSPDSSDQPGPAAQLLGSRTTADTGAAAADQVRAAHSTHRDQSLFIMGAKGVQQPTHTVRLFTLAIARWLKISVQNRISTIYIYLYINFSAIEC